jgi:uncharacterized membrane protein YvbJ
MLKCPYCAERIRSDATRCRFCQQLLVSEDAARAAVEKFNKKRNAGPWTGIIIALISCVAGLMLVMAIYNKVSSFVSRAANRESTARQIEEKEKRILDEIFKRIDPQHSQTEAENRTILEKYLKANPSSQ